MDQRRERVGSQTIYMPTYDTADLLATLACTVVGPSAYHREKWSYINNCRASPQANVSAKDGYSSSLGHTGLEIGQRPRGNLWSQGKDVIPNQLPIGCWRLVAGNR